MQETWVRSLGQEDPLEKGMAAYPGTLAWRIPWTEDVPGYSPWDCKELDTTVQLTFLFLSKKVKREMAGSVSYLNVECSPLTCSINPQKQTDTSQLFCCRKVNVHLLLLIVVVVWTSVSKDEEDCI